MGLRNWYLREKRLCPQDEARNFAYLVLARHTQMGLMENRWERKGKSLRISLAMALLDGMEYGHENSLGDSKAMEVGVWICAGYWEG